MQRCKDMADLLQQKVYLCIYDERLNRITEYQSETGFDWQECSKLMENAKKVGPRVKLALRTYIGADVRNYVPNEKQEEMNAKDFRPRKPDLRKRKPKEVELPMPSKK